MLGIEYEHRVYEFSSMAALLVIFDGRNKAYWPGTCSTFILYSNAFDASPTVVLP